MKMIFYVDDTELFFLDNNHIRSNGRKEMYDIHMSEIQTAYMNSRLFWSGLV